MLSAGAGAAGAGGGSSKLRLSAAKSNGRLLKGYGPLAALLVAFVLMAMLVPTKAPQQDVVHETQKVTRRHRDGLGAASKGTAGTSGTSAAGTAVARRPVARRRRRTRRAGRRRAQRRRARWARVRARAGVRRPVLAAVHLVLGEQRGRHVARVSARRRST